jgi:hypothetical protein
MPAAPSPQGWQLTEARAFLSPPSYTGILLCPASMMRSMSARSSTASAGTENTLSSGVIAFWAVLEAMSMAPWITAASSSVSIDSPPSSSASACSVTSARSSWRRNSAVSSPRTQSSSFPNGQVMGQVMNMRLRTSQLR